MALLSHVSISFGSPLDAGSGVGLPTITPHQITLCYLVKGYLSPGDHDPAGSWLQRQALGDALLRSMRRADAIREPSMQAAVATLQSEVEDNLRGTVHGGDSSAYIADIGRSMRWHMEAIRSVDALNALFEGLAHMVTTSTNLRAEESVGADDNSVMGFFLRRCWCDYTALPFEATMSLVEACKAYAAPLGAAPQPQSFKPRAAVERFLVDAAERMEREAGAAPQAQLEWAARAVQAAAPRLPAVEATYAAGARIHRDAAACLDSLHHYFDRPLDPGVPSVGVVAAGDVPPPYIIGGMPGGRPAGARLQGAALSVGLAHARLGEVEAAVAALNEAMNAAQQAGDDDCLCTTLAALCQVVEAATPGTMPEQIPRREGGAAAAHVKESERMLERCMARAEQLGLPHIAGYSRLSLARRRLLNPPAQGAPPDADAPPPRSPAAAETSAAVRYTAHLHLAATLAAAVPVSPPAHSGFACLRIMRGLGELFVPTGHVFSASLLGAHAASAAEVAHLAAAAPLLRSASWELFGGRRAALAHTLAFLDVHGATARAEEAATAWAQAAVGVAAAHGFKAAQAVLDLADRRFPRSQSFTLAAARLTVAHERALHRRELRRAMALAKQLAALAAPGDATAIGWRLDGEERIVRTLLAGNAHSAAEKAAQLLFALATDTRQPLSAARLLLLIARIHLEAGSPGTALPYVLSMATQAHELHADLAGAEAAVMMGSIWRAQGGRHWGRARAAIEGALHVILAHGGLELRARARVALAETVMASKGTKEEMAEEAEWVLSVLGDAALDYTRLEDWQCARHVHYLAALLLDSLGAEERRETASAEFVRLGEMKAAAFDAPPTQSPGGAALRQQAATAGQRRQQPARARRTSDRKQHQRMQAG